MNITGDGTERRDEDDQDDKDNEETGDTRRSVFLRLSLERIMLKKLGIQHLFVGLFPADFEWKEGGGLRGGSDLSWSLTLGVPG